MKSKSKLESAIQKKILAYLKGKAYITRVTSSSKNGEPDIICCWQGKYVAIEVKQVGEKAEPLQDVKHERIRKHGGIVIVATSVEDVRRIIEPMEINVCPLCRIKMKREDGCFIDNDKYHCDKCGYEIEEI